MRNLFKNENGSAIVLVALSMVVLMGVAACVVDVGVAFAEKAQLQNAADAAALAGAQELPENPEGALEVANSYAEANSLKNGELDINLASDNSAISVTASNTVPTFFARVLGIDESDVSVNATATIGVAGSVPWIVPFVIPKPPEFNYEEVYVMRMYGAGDYLDYPATGYPSGYDYPSDFKGHIKYKNYPLSNRYPYQFDYMNVYIEKDTNFNHYIEWLKNGYHKTFSQGQKMYYYAPSSGGKPSVEAFKDRLKRDKNKNYKKAKIGDARVILIPVVEKMLKRNTSQSGNVSIKIIGFAGFFIEEVHHTSAYGETFWFEGRFLEDLNVGTGEITYDPNADFGLRVIKLTK